MKKFIAFFLLTLFLMAPLSSFSQEITDATKAAAAKAPSSKLVGTWWCNSLKYVFNANGTGIIYFPNATGSEFYKYTQRFTYIKKGDHLQLICKGKNDGFTATPINKKNHETLALYYGKADAQKKLRETVDLMKIGARIAAIQLTGTVLYLDNDYMAVAEQETRKVFWCEKESHINKREAEEEARKKAEEKEKAEAARLKAEKEERERIMSNNWETTCKTNTIEGYESFLANYPESKFTSEAQKKISELKCQQEWNVLQNSDDIEALRKFIESYPDFPFLNNAKSRLYALEGLEAFNKGDKELAIDKFKLVTVESAIPAQAMNAYSESQQVIQYRKLSPESSPVNLEIYLHKFPQSPYTTEVRNYLALSLANNFHPGSTQEDYSKALSYASGTTVESVNEKIEKNKENEKLLAKQHKKEEREANGGWGGLLLEYGDFTWNGRNEDGLFQYNFGIKLKVGNFNDRIQFALGIKPGVGVWDFKGIYNEKEPGKSSTFFEMPVEAELRINLFKTGLTSWCYLDGRFDYNVVRKKEIQTPMGFFAGIGFAGRYMDITFFYGKQLGTIDDTFSVLNGLPNPFRNSKNNNNFGLSFSWYIGL